MNPLLNAFAMNAFFIATILSTVTGLLIIESVMDDAIDKRGSTLDHALGYTAASALLILAVGLFVVALLLAGNLYNFQSASVVCR